MRFATLALLLGLLAQPPIAFPPRDARPAPPEGTGVIRGRVVRADTGAPVRRALVRVSGRPLNETLGALTDENGRYEVPRLPAGDYTVTATKTGLLNGFYGSGVTRERPRMVTLRAGERANQIDIALQPAAVLSGRVVDDAGEPVARAGVMALGIIRQADGSRRVNPRGEQSSTDDRGMFRLFGIAPGSYLIHVQPWGSDVRLATGVSPAPTYYPGVTAQSDATPLTLTAGQEYAGVTVVMQTMRPVRVSGIVQSSHGKPFDGAAMLMERGGVPVAGPHGFARVREDGRFEFRGVPPGDYTIQVHAGDRARQEGGSQAITVGTEDLEDIVVISRPPALIHGDVVFDVEPLDRPSLTKITVHATPRTPGEGGFFSSEPSAHALDPSGRFAIPAPRTEVRMYLGGLPEDFFLQQVLHRGADITTKGLDVDGDKVDGVRLVLARANAEVLGVVVDGSGGVVQDYLAAVLAHDAPGVDEAMRDRRFGIGEPDQNRQFRIRSLRAGRYLAIAVRQRPVDGWDAAFVRLRPKAAAFELSDGEKKVVNLTVVEDE